MKILFIISGSIAAKKNLNVLNILKKKGVYVNCIVTDSAKKIINLNSLKKYLPVKSANGCLREFTPILGLVLLISGLEEVVYRKNKFLNS